MSNILNIFIEFNLNHMIFLISAQSIRKYIIILTAAAFPAILNSQHIYSDTTKPAYFTVISKNLSTLYGGFPNSVFIDMSRFGNDSIRVVSEDSLLNIQKVSKKWYTVTPRPFKKSVGSNVQLYQYDSTNKIFYTVGTPSENDSTDRYEASINIYHYKLVNNKYELQYHTYDIFPKRKIKERSTSLLFNVIPTEWNSQVALNGWVSGSKIDTSKLTVNSELFAYTAFRSKNDCLYDPLGTSEFVVTGYTFNFLTSDGDVVSIPVMGNKLSSQVIRSIKKDIAKDGIIAIDDIKIRNKLTGRAERAPGLVYFLL